MPANEHQVGGRHYKTAYEHWDLVTDVGMGYLAGCATKYVARHRKKGGIEDLRKALHYVDKLIEVASEPSPFPGLSPRVNRVTALERFAQINGLTAQEKIVMETIVLWETVGDLVNIRRLIATMIERSVPIPAPVPLTEENHYSPRIEATVEDESNEDRA